jgi:NADP-dependent 3-hydroxy acid dehydrogenase YdfG
VVTGATDGIGKEFAYQLGKAGFNVLLVARNKETLAQTASEIGDFLPDYRSWQLSESAIQQRRNIKCLPPLTQSILRQRTILLMAYLPQHLLI